MVTMTMRPLAVPVVPIVQMGVPNFVTAQPRPPPPQITYVPPPTHPQPPPPPRMQNPLPPQPLGGPPKPPTEDEPPTKRQKTEDQLVPEADWLARNTGSGTVDVSVHVPDMADKAEYKLQGQTIDILLNLTDTITSIKQKIQEETQMPASKQKLFYEGMFIKDSQSLAFYNMAPKSLITLQMKERGGRKR